MVNLNWIYMLTLNWKWVVNITEISSKGEFIIDFENNYDYIGVSEGVIFVIKNNLSGVVNDKNEILIPLIVIKTSNRE